MKIENAEIWYPRLDPKRPNSKFNKENPTWEVQLRTTDKEEMKRWKALSLRVKPVMPDEGEPYFACNLRKRSKKRDGSSANAPKVVDHKLDELDPRTIGNGSKGNIRVYQYESTYDGSTVSMLQAVQITEHVVYEPVERDPEDDFQVTKGKVINANGEPAKAPPKPKSPDLDDLDLDDDDDVF